MEGKEKKKTTTAQQVIILQAQLIETQTALRKRMEASERQENELNAYRRANSLMETELVRLRNENASLSETNDKLMEENEKLKKGNFFKKLFKRK